VDERSDPQAPAGRRPPPPVAAAASRLSPPQEAWQRYVDHTLNVCDTCRGVDGTPCQQAEDLYAAWREVADAAMDRVWHT
jgi:hypothetical protein